MQYHMEFGGESTPRQRFTGDFNITATLRVGRRMMKKTVKFNLDTCTFNQNLVIDF